ncbi:MAG: hypothetical protein LW860_18030 [Xanthomonadaceae bacterium]|nr:hypothetical protein [Xanthomonadaceae bacterium]
MRPTLIALSIGLACGSAFAQEEPAPRAEPDTLLSMAEYDRDGDGTVTVAEFLSRVAESDLPAANGCDADRDGLLSAGEHEVCGSLLLAPQPR